MEQELRDEYLPKVKEQTLETLPAFINELMNRDHDYGSICVAIGLSAAAAAWACERSSKGGITGFQAGAVFWEFVRGWGSPGIGEAGARFVNYDDYLFPQYEHKFRTIDKHTMSKLQEIARRRLEEVRDGHIHPDVLAHWKSLAAGNPPFGFTIWE